MENRHSSTSNFKQIVIFFIKGIVFFAPLFILFFFSLGMLWLSGEFIPTSHVIESWRDVESRVLFEKAYISDEYDFKQQILHERNPEMIALGNSRVLELREEMFVSTTIFYNLAGVGDIESFRSSLETIPVDSKLSVIILGLDQSFLNRGRWEELQDSKAHVSEKKKYSWKKDLFGASKNVLIDFFRGKISIVRFLSADSREDTVGMSAFMRNSGIRRDGSRRYGDIIAYPSSTKHEDYNFRDTFWRIENDKNLFRWGEDISEEALREFELFLDEASRRNIHVVAFLPPYAPTVYSKMISFDNKYDYIAKIKPAFKDVFATHNFSFFDFTNSQTTFDGVTDSEFLDGFHGSEKIYLRLLINMAENDSILGSYTDLELLKEILKEEKTSLEVSRWK